MKIKNKILNHFTENGEKKTSEQILLKSIKEIQKFSKKQSKQLIKLALTFTTPIFKNCKRTIKKKKKFVKEFPMILLNKKTRISSAIKFIQIAILENKKTNSCYINLYKNILLNTKSNKERASEIKNTIQEQALLKKHVFWYYR